MGSKEDGMVTIASVLAGGPAARRGLAAGDIIHSINGEKVLDDIDYQALTSVRHVCLVVESPGKAPREVDIIKAPEASLGLTLASSALPPPRECANHCIFCFVDQMPAGMRPSLYIKDDDWRYSLMMGNFITLTNVGEHEFERILRRKASPLYISVQSTDPENRRHMLGNPHAGDIMQRLRRLAENGIRFHCQVVLCPNENDGTILKQTLDDLYSLRPYALSVALVPVGLTRFRERLYAVKPYQRGQALEVLRIIAGTQARSAAEYGDHFAYPADEFISITSSPVPPRGMYDDFPQLENGIGMLRKFEDELASCATLASKADGAAQRTVCLPCGVSVAPYMKQWVRQYIPAYVKATVLPIANRFFGETVTVTGLITATDLLEQLQGVQADEVLIAETMLNSDRTLFLDNITYRDFARKLPLPCRIVENDGEAFYRAVCNLA